MLAVSSQRIDAKRRATVDPRKRQFASEKYDKEEYEHRMNFYTIPPTGDIALENFEEWAIARLKVLAELEACQFRNKTPQETEEYMRPVLDKWLRLDNNASRSEALHWQRKKDHYSHWTLRLAFAGTADLRQRFTRLEAMLFKLRLQTDESRERRAFIESLPMSWQILTAEERHGMLNDLKAATGFWRDDEESWFKVDWETVPDLVERRQVLLKRGMAYVHVREQTTLIVNEFTRSLEGGLEQAARFLPRMDEENRLAPILHHLSQSFIAPDAGYSEASSIGDLASISAGSIEGLSSHFPLCMQNLQRDLKKNSHLKHFSRLQYTLFLKGIGLNLNECIVFWRKSFKLITDEKFKSEYLYNIRHAYGDVGGDSNKRGRGYTPYSCQKLLTEPLPSAGQNHGCPYRTYSPDNLITLLQNMGMNNPEVLRGVKDDVARQRYHIACNRIFEAAHKNELKRVKEQNLWPASELDTILHPNTYFKRSYMLKHLDKLQQSGDMGIDGPT
ncbi:hypothetical protein AMS68_003759 [Peltaster fructicola]|uniref:DNA primase large subunit n=1 Tax=Peltaster fructicola TaxID=286661 RepID=A0A6H0XTZ1_9PEZI|nr:hypothetical protein AMS68_003759 [Peltaster fructicola]